MPPLRLDGGLLDLPDAKADEGVEAIGLACDHVLHDGGVHEVDHLAELGRHLLADEVLETDGEHSAT